MGRYAQRLRRGGGGGAGVPITPNTVTLLSVQSDGTDWILTFSGPITTDSGATPDANFDVDGTQMTTISPAVGNVCSANFDGEPYDPGLPWNLTGQPNWLLTPVVFPASGTTT